MGTVTEEVVDDGNGSLGDRGRQSLLRENRDAKLSREKATSLEEIKSSESVDKYQIQQIN